MAIGAMAIGVMVIGVMVIGAIDWQNSPISQ
jgi:hypothetical protein